MSQADALLASLDVTYGHTHSVVDSDSYFVIDPVTREIENATRQRNILMQFDHCSERYTFQVDRYVEGHDMTLCTHVKVHYINIDGKTGEEKIGVVDLLDLQLNPNLEDTVICSWLITRDSTQLAGPLSFLVQYMCKDDDGAIVYEWHSDIYSDAIVKAGRNNGEHVVSEYADILEQWRERLFGVEGNLEDILLEGQAQVEAVRTEGQTQLAAVQAEGQSQVTAIQTEGQTQLEVVQNEGEAQVNSIRTEGESQVSAVKAEGSTQIEAIQALGEQQRQQIADNLTEVLNQYFADQGIQIPSDEHINELIYEALGVVADGSY